MAEYVVGYVQEYKAPDGSVEVHNLNGISWIEAPIPRKWHKCWVQTWGWTGYFNKVYRCACGAISNDRKVWIEKNTRTRVPTPI